MRRRASSSACCAPAPVCGCWPPAARVSASPVRSAGRCRRWAPSDASALFRERAEAGGLDARTDDAALVERICDRLDGLPLAVELAAARTRSLSLDDIVDRIDDRFRLLTTGGRTAEPRQQTLRGVVDWSYDLLFADEQRVFRRLSVFAGGFDLAAAEAVCAGDDVAVGDIVDILGHLVDKSLVSVVEPRRRHPLPAAADARRLRPGAPGRGRRGTTRPGTVICGGWSSSRPTAEPGLRGPDQPRWIRRLGLELDNARAALEWAVHRGRAADAVALAAGMAYGWYITGAVAGRARPSSSGPWRMEGESSAEHRAVAGAWGAWLIQIGAGATGQRRRRLRRAGRRDRPRRVGAGVLHGGGRGVAAARLPGSHGRGDRAHRGSGRRARRRRPTGGGRRSSTGFAPVWP